MHISPTLVSNRSNSYSYFRTYDEFCENEESVVAKVWLRISLPLVPWFSPFFECLKTLQSILCWQYLSIALTFDFQRLFHARSFASSSDGRFRCPNRDGSICGDSKCKIDRTLCNIPGGDNLGHESVFLCFIAVEFSTGPNEFFGSGFTDQPW